jgi:hypothetical protein
MTLHGGWITNTTISNPDEGWDVAFPIPKLFELAHTRHVKWSDLGPGSEKSYDSDSEYHISIESRILIGPLWTIAMFSP